jgi:tRNA(Ile)-lysidine synthase
VHLLAKNLLNRIRKEELIGAGECVGVAVSGGIDSTALLRLLLELRSDLGIVLSVVHFNHKLRGAEAGADQEFVAGLATEHGLEFYCSSGDVNALAAERHSGIEAAAREMRYEFFRGLLGGEGASAAEAALDGQVNRSAKSAAPPKGEPQGLEPNLPPTLIGTAKVLSRGQPALDKIATGHTLDDQAETVLMRLIRGTGMRGLGGIHPRVLIEDEDEEFCGEIVRPLLGVRRRELEQYLRDLNQPWREDSTNSEPKFTRNRVRQLVLPLLEREFNPVIAENLSELAEIARDEEDYWENEVSGWLGTVAQWSQPEWTRGLPGFEDSQALVQIGKSLSDPDLLRRLEETGPAIANATLSRPWLLSEQRAVQRRAIKAIGEEAGIPLEFKHVEEILRFAAEEGPTGKQLALPMGWKVIREPEAIVFVTPDLRGQERIPDYAYQLPIPGRAAIPELGTTIEAMCVTLPSDVGEYNPQQLLRADLLKAPLTVRNWRAGDRFWPARTKGPKKVKELLQERHVTQPERRLWPVVMSGSEIVWVRDFPVPAKLRTDAAHDAVLIRELREIAER